MTIHYVQHPTFYDLTSPNSYVVTGDCIAVMQSLPDNCVDLVFADPPYNLQLQQPLHRPGGEEFRGVFDSWDQVGDFAAYDEFTRRWLREARRVMKPTGTLWVMGMYHGLYRVGTIMQDLGFWLLNSVIWQKANPVPQMRGVRFCNAHEELIWAAKCQKHGKYCFNYQQMKAENGGKQMRSVWRFGICQGHERLKGADGKKLHSTQKPIALLERVVLATSKEGDLILDPFAGVGTTAAAALRHDRRFLVVEQEADYTAAIRQRLQRAKESGAASE